MDADVEGALRSGSAVTVRSLAALRGTSLLDARHSLARNAPHYSSGCAILVTATPGSPTETRVGLERVAASSLGPEGASRLYALASPDVDLRTIVHANAEILYRATRPPVTVPAVEAGAGEPAAKRLDAGEKPNPVPIAAQKATPAIGAKPPPKQGNLLSFFQVKKKA